MDLAKLNPWNWFRKEEEQDRNAAAGRAPVSRTQPQPANPLDALHGEIDRLFDSAFEGFAGPRLAGGRGRHFRPKVDIAGDEKEYGIAVELPGVEEKDIRIETLRRRVEHLGRAAARGKI
jgi:HSP20 family protein